MYNIDRRETYSFNFFDGDREVIHKFSVPEGMTYTMIIDKFYDFLSGVYGYDIRQAMQKEES